MKTFKTIAISAILIIAMLFIVACEKTNNPKEEIDYTRENLSKQFLEKADEVIINENSVTFKDASGAESVTIGKNPSKVINLYASYTTLWYEAGGTVSGLIGGATSVVLYENQIGRAITQDEGVEVLSTSAAGSRFDTELIISKQPDLIIAATAMSGYSTIKAPAETAEIPVIAVSYDDFADYMKWFKVFSHLTGNEELWESVAMNSLNEVIDILMKIPEDANPKVFSIFSGPSAMQANLSGTVVGGMAKKLRASNIADSWWNNSSDTRLTINLESVYAYQPDFILVQCHGEKELAEEFIETQYGEDPIWNGLDAVKEGRVYYLEKGLFHNKPNKRFAEAYRIMAEMLYPDIDFDA